MCKRADGADAGLSLHRPGGRLHPHLSCTEQPGDAGSQPAKDVRSPPWSGYACISRGAQQGMICGCVLSPRCVWGRTGVPGKGQREHSLSESRMRAWGPHYIDTFASHCLLGASSNWRSSLSD